MSGSGISWAICKSAPRSRQTTTLTPHHSFFTGRMPFLPPNQQRQSTEGTSSYTNDVIHKFCKYHHVIVPANKLLQMSVQETSFMLVACKDCNLPMMLQLTGCKEQRWKGYWTPDIRWKLSQLLQLMVDLFYRGKSSFARPLPVVRGSYCSRLFLQNSFSFLGKLGKCRFISRNYNYFSLLSCVLNF